MLSHYEKQTIRLIAGAILAALLLYKPIASRALVSIPMAVALDDNSKLSLLYTAAKLDPCFTTLQDELGKQAFNLKRIGVALTAYGNAIKCSPADSVLRIKYGEILLSQGWDGLFAIKEALALEPNNPIYQEELRRVTTHQQQSP